jgi:hypothetical protein
MIRTTSMTETACFEGSAIVTLQRDSGDALSDSGKNPERKALRPSVEARVAAAVLRLQQAGELDAAEALLKLVAGGAASPAAKPKKPPGRARNTPWHAEASRLRAQGFDLKAIAAELRRPQSLVRWALDENGERMRARQRVKASRSRHAAHGERRDEEVVIRSKRDIRAVLPPQEVKMAAIKSFAAGEINAGELQRVLRTPPRGDAL